MKMVKITWVAVFFLCTAGSGCVETGDEKAKEVYSSNAYKGHENDLDSHYFVNNYPGAIATRLDDCQTCHRGGEFTYEKNGKKVVTFKNSCDYCHLKVFPDDTLEGTHPKTFADTLNPYGSDYLAAGRNADAIKSIDGNDSDADGFSNGDEIDALKYPGDPGSKPGQANAPLFTMTMSQMKTLSSHEEFLLVNSHKQEFDTYATYKGVRVDQLLEHAGVDIKSSDFQGITVIAPDGYMKDFTVDDVLGVFPQSLYYGLFGTSDLGSDCGFVKYPDSMPDGLVDGEAIPDEQRLIIAYERDGLPMDSANLDVTSGKINGEGPFRIILPQSTPGEPDRGSKYSPTECNDGHDYDDAKDHNAGDMVRGTIAIRVNPMPDGLEEFDHYNGGWSYAENKSLIIYGFGISKN